MPSTQIAYGSLLPDAHDADSLRTFVMVNGESHVIAEGVVFTDGRVIVSRSGGDVVERHRDVHQLTREWVGKGFMLWCPHSGPRDATATPRRFLFRRETDVTGVSGQGVAIEGVQWSHGGVHLVWLGKVRSLVEWASVEEAEAIHGHDGATRLEWLDPA
jgi:hypothetical protein